MKNKINWILYILIICISINATGYKSLTEDLPRDERAALIELEDGFLDSATWERVKPFYSQPLSVPLGELRYLKDVFSDLPEDLPVDHEKLSKYEPWKSKNITAFFKDYPYLLPFRAILSFKSESLPSIAHVGFFSRLSGLSNTFSQSVKFTFNPVNDLRLDGTVGFNDDFARWRRRRIQYTIPHVGKLQAGNFSFSMNNGLFYGYFPKSTESYDIIKYNWLYGNTRTWNGLSLKTPLRGKNTIKTLFHYRETEALLGMKAEFYPGSIFSFYCGASGARTLLSSNIYDTSFAVHGGVTASTKLFDISMESGVNPENAGKVPVYLTLSQGKRKHKHTVSVVRIPEGFCVPRSSVVRSFYSDLETTDSTASDITAVNLSSSSHFTGYLKQLVRASYVVMENRADLRTSWKITFTKPFEYSFFYGLSTYDPAGNLKHRFKISTDYSSESIFGISSNVICDLKQDYYWRVLANMQTDFKLFSFVELSPFMNYISSSTYNDFAVGVAQRVDFFKKTYGEFIITVPVVSHYNEKYSFYAKVYFLF